MKNTIGIMASIIRWVPQMYDSILKSMDIYMIV